MKNDRPLSKPYRQSPVMATNFTPFMSKFDEIIEEQSCSVTSNSGSSSSELSDMRYRLRPPNIFVLGLDDESVHLPT